MIKKLLFIMAVLTGCAMPSVQSGIEPVTVSQDTRKITNPGLIDFGINQFAVNGVIYNFGTGPNKVPVLDGNGKLDASLIPTSASSFSGEFSDLAHLPNTIAGYGIIDFNALGDARWSLVNHTHNFASITFKPNTLAGYGITDGQPLNAGLTTLATVSGAFGLNTIYYHSGLNTWSPVTMGANMVFDASTGVLSSTASGSGSGTVSTFSADGLDPLFSTSVDTATTAPALHFSLLDAPANSLLGAVSAGPPTYLSATNARLALGVTSVGQNLMLLSNPGAVTFLKVNADNTVTARSAVNFKTDLSLNLVENTALSTWGGSATITQLGTINTGVWNGTPLTDSYIASATTWNAKQSSDAKLSAFVGLTGVVADRLPYFTGSTTMGLTAFTPQARLLLANTDAPTMRTTLGLGTLSTQNGTFSGTSSGTNTGDQSLFGTIAVAGQSSITPNSTNTTLTLAAGSNVTLATNTATRTVTITSTGGGSGGTPPTGTGFRHVTSGTEDTAAVLVANADIASNAAIARSKISFADSDLAGGTTLAQGTIYHDTLVLNRTLTISGTLSSAMPPTVVRFDVQGAPRTLTLTQPVYRIGESGPITSVTLPVGKQEMSWVYANGILWEADSAGLTPQTGDLGDAMVALSLMTGSPTLRQEEVSGGTLLSSPHFAGSGSTPAITIGTAAGTGAGTPTITGKDAGGNLSVTTGTSPASNAVLFTVTFATPYPTAPAVSLTATTINAALTWNKVYVVPTTTGFTVNVGSGGLNPSVPYGFSYGVIQ